MTITGSKYQSFDWENIKKILIRAGMAIYGELKPPNERLEKLLSGNKHSECIQEWPQHLLEQLGRAYINNTPDKTVQSNAEEHNERVSLAIEITDILSIQSQRIEQLNAKIQQVAQKNPSKEDWNRHCYKLLSDFFSELRYIKDAENITISIGRSITAQHVRILAKIEELNRKVEKVLAEGDLHTLAELTGENVRQLQSNPFLINRYTNQNNRPALIIAADKLYRAKANKLPQLPTKKYNNLVNPDIIASCLTELDTTQTTSLTGFNASENSEYDKLNTHLDHAENDWLDELIKVVHQAHDQPPYTDTSNHFWDSPDIDNLKPARISKDEANHTCLSLIKPIIKLGLILKWDKNNDMINLLSADDLAPLQGKKLSKATLASQIGQTVYKFEKSVQQAEQDYKVCIQKTLGLKETT